MRNRHRMTYTWATFVVIVTLSPWSSPAGVHPPREPSRSVSASVPAARTNTARPLVATVSAVRMWFRNDYAWSSYLDEGRGISQVNTVLTVPYVSQRCGPSAEVSAWVGMGGYLDYPFVQNGVTFTPTGVGAWYEVFDKYGHTTEVNVDAGIRVHDKVRLLERFSSDHKTLTFYWDNLTRHTSTHRTITDAARYYNGDTAEWIMERSPIDPAVPHPNLSPYGTITFTDAYSYSGSGWHALFPSTVQIALWTPQFHILNSVRPTSSTSYASTWQACN